jgi:hypothetical protein
MDQVTEDFNDASWHQAQLDERNQIEQRMLSDDPGYIEFLLTYEEAT